MDYQTQDPFMHRVNTDIVREQSNHYTSIAVRVVDIAGAFLVSLLAVRFAFMLLGANATNGLASFVYGFTAPFVVPFAGLFNYDNFAYGVSHFEGFTLLAMGFYSLITAGLRRLAAVAWW